MILVKNGTVVTETELLEDSSVVIEGDRIQQILTREETERFEKDHAENCQVIDARGDYISPGFIDIHSDYIETIASPRPTAMMDFDFALKESERILVGHGITTMFHSLSLYRDDLFEVKKIRFPENSVKLIEAINQMHYEEHMIRHRVHARFEVDNFEMIQPLKQMIEEDKVHLLSIMDHTPGAGQYHDIDVYKKTLMGYRGITDEEAGKIATARQERELLPAKEIHELADVALAHGISVASHDDDTDEKLEFGLMMGATISEFPITIDIAKKAKKKGMFTIAGAPNILLGGSHTGNLSAAEGITEGAIDILCSDYYPPALVHAIFVMHEKYGIPLVKMFQMLTLHPAKAVGIDDELGSIAPGKKADILLIQEERGLHNVRKAIVDGNLVYDIHYRS